MIAKTGAVTDNDITDDVRTMADGSVVLGGGRMLRQRCQWHARMQKVRAYAENAALRERTDHCRENGQRTLDPWVES